jgi:hypothetical protein
MSLFGKRVLGFRSPGKNAPCAGLSRYQKNTSSSSSSYEEEDLEGLGRCYSLAKFL